MNFSPLSAIALVCLAVSIGSTLQAHPGTEGQVAHSIRDETYIDTPGTTQNLCGDSTFEAVDPEGPLRQDCEYLMITTKQNPDGFWMVGNFGRDGNAWVEFTRLRTCGIRVRRTDGQDCDVPFGDEDMVDLVNSVLTEFTGGMYLPTVQGQMTCNKFSASAAVEWQIFSVVSKGNDPDLGHGNLSCTSPKALKGTS